MEAVLGCPLTCTLRNTPGVPLSNVAVWDDDVTPVTAADDFTPTFSGGDTFRDDPLDTTETWTVTASRIATAGQSPLIV